MRMRRFAVCFEIQIRIISSNSTDKERKMDIVNIVKDYQGKFAGRAKGFHFGSPGVINSNFIFYLTKDSSEDLFDFLTSIGALLSVYRCDCGQSMKVVTNRESSDGRMFFCGNSARSKRCVKRKSIRHGSFFTGSKLGIGTIFRLVYEIFEGSSFERINKEIGVWQHAVVDWRRYVTDVLIQYVVDNTEKIGGRGKIVEIDESKMGKRKYNRGHFVEGQWVFGGVERETGRCFLVAVHDRSAETLLDLINMWIEPGTTIISDCWKAYEKVGDLGYQHLTVNHSLHFVNPETGAHTNTVESTWRHFKVSLNPYNRQGDFEGYIAWFMFRKICNASKIDPFVKFWDIVRGINWADWHIVSGGAGEGSTE